MHLYNITLQSPTAVTQAIVGNFSGARQQEIIVSRGTRLELLRPDASTGKISTVIANDVFGSIRSLAAFRLTGGTKGELAVRIVPLFLSFSSSSSFLFLRLRNSRL
jgi:splicing factor 3B subunit 3